MVATASQAEGLRGQFRCPTAVSSFKFFETAALFREDLTTALHPKPAYFPAYHPAPIAPWCPPKSPISPRMLAPLLPLSPEDLEYRRNLSLRRRQQVRPIALWFISKSKIMCTRELA